MPVVALETTVVTHGFPNPRGIETARGARESRAFGRLAEAVRA